MDRYADAMARHLPDALGRGWQVAVHADPAYPAWSRFAARWLLHPYSIDWARWDLVHVLDHSYAHLLHRRPPRRRAVVTVHDLLALQPATARRTLRTGVVDRLNQWVCDGLQSADACVCDSRCTRESLIARYPTLASRSRVQPLGVDERFFVVDREAARARGRRLTGVDSNDRLVLHVGSCVARKNVDGLLAAIARLAATDRHVRLLQVGGRFTPAQRALIDRLDLTRRVRQLSFVGERDLPFVYAAADVLAMPSLYEGFGLPVLEAFAVGVPVVATRHASLSEFPVKLLHPVHEGGAEPLSAALHDVFASPDEARWRAGLARAWARGSTWAHVARATAAVYQS
jgi:glycosyltransferase involved in cell wall biosynthesis